MLRFNGYSAIQIIHKIFQPLIDDIPNLSKSMFSTFLLIN